MAARDADARVARMNARLESMSAVLIGVVRGRGEVDCNNQRILSSDAAIRLLIAFRALPSIQYGKRTFRHEH
jgi:hypothetical protein